LFTVSITNVNEYSKNRIKPSIPSNTGIHTSKALIILSLRDEYVLEGISLTTTLFFIHFGEYHLKGI